MRANELLKKRRIIPIRKKKKQEHEKSTREKVPCALLFIFNSSPCVSFITKKKRVPKDLRVYCFSVCLCVTNQFDRKRVDYVHFLVQIKCW